MGVNVYLWLGVPAVFWFWWNFIGWVVTMVVAFAVSAMTGHRTQPIEDDGKVPTATPSEDLQLRHVAILLGAFVVMLVFSVSLPTLIRALG